MSKKDKMKSLKGFSMIVLCVLVAVGMVTSSLILIPGSGEATQDHDDQAILDIDGLYREPPPIDYFNLTIDLPFIDLFWLPVYLFLEPVQQRDASMSPFMDVMVEGRIYSDIEDELERYADDVESTGLGVRIYTVGSLTSPETIRSHLDDSRPGLVGAFLVGNVSAAWYEMDTQWDPLPKPAKHEEFPSDLFYMDTDGLWQDNDTDGLYDYHADGSGDVEADIWIGRLRADHMSGDEITLLTDYFDKNHEFREGNISFDQDALVYVDDDWSPANGVRDAVAIAFPSPTHVTDKDTTTKADYLGRLDEGWSIVHVMCHGNPSGHNFKIVDPANASRSIYETPRVNAVPDIKGLDETTSPVMFYNLFVCSGGRYTSSNYLAGWHVLNPSTTLLALGSSKTGSMINEVPFYTPIGNGNTVGDSFTDWMAVTAETARHWVYGMSLTGDPTLRITGKHLVNIDVSGLSVTGLTTVDYTEDGTAKSISIGNGVSSIYCDHGTQLSIDPTVTGSVYTTTDQVEFTVVEPIADLDVQYYEQSQVTINTNGLPMFPAAAVSYTQNGVLKSKLAWDGNPFSELCDVGTTVEIEEDSMVSSTERYHTTDTNSWMITGDIIANVNYMHQYWVTCAVDTIGVLDLNVANHIDLDYEMDGAGLNAQLYDGLSLASWMDEYSYYTFSNPSSGSTTAHRWYTPDATSYQVTGSVTITMTYWEQYKCRVESTGACLSASDPGIVGYYQFGSSMTANYCDLNPWEDWCDVGTAITMSEIVLIDADERCHTNDPTSHVVDDSETYYLDYHKEIKITIEAEGLPDTTYTEVTIGTANPSWPDDTSGGDVDDLVVVLDSTNGFSWTNWTHDGTALTATELIEIDQSEKYLLICWTVNYTTLTFFSEPPSVDADYEGALYTAHYLGVKKNIWQEEAGLAQPVMVSIEVSTTWAIDTLDTLNLTDDLPNEFSFVFHSATINGLPNDPVVNEIMVPPKHQQLEFDLGNGDQNITYEVRINRAYATDTMVSNEVTVEIQLPYFPSLSLGVSDDLIILVYEGPTLSKVADGPEVVIVGTNVSWEFTFIVKNNFDYAMVEAVLKDHFGAELDFITDSVMCNLVTDQEVTYSNGKMKQVRLEWSIDQVAEGEAFMLQITVYTKLNPAGHQEYTSPGCYALNSGATLKWLDDRGKKHSLETGSIWVIAVPEIS
jgi:hypothetical protein